MGYKIIGKVISIKGTCAAGLKVGDEIDLTIPCVAKDFNWWKKNPKVICPHLLNAISLHALVLQSGGQLPWQKKDDEVEVMCPDPENVVTLILKRIKE